MTQTTTMDTITIQTSELVAVLREIVRETLHEELYAWRDHSDANATPVSTLGVLLESEFFGMWREREDLPASSTWARTLRAQAWERGG